MSKRERIGRAFSALFSGVKGRCGDGIDAETQRQYRLARRACMKAFVSLGFAARLERDDGSIVLDPTAKLIAALKTFTTAIQETRSKPIANDPPSVVIYTDGACSSNSGIGGWGAILFRGKKRLCEICGGDPETTSNRMELMGAICGLESLDQPSTVTVYTDSYYLINGMTKWVARWKINGWITKTGTPVKNQDLWERLDTTCMRHQVSWKWVKAHSGDRFNEQADSLARKGLGKALREQRVVGQIARPQIEQARKRHSTARAS